MPTQAQIQANRSNAQKSTGPKTPQGKAAAAKNSIKHGLLASQNVISSESQDEFDLHRDQLLEELNPATPLESMLAERIVSLSWRLKRTETIQNQAIDALDERNNNSPFAKLTKSMLSRLQPPPQDAPAEPTPDLPLGRLAVKDFSNSRVLDRLLMYERRIENSLHKTMLELQRLKLINNINTENQASSTNNDSELLPITGSSRGQAKSSAGFPNRLAPSPVGGVLFNPVKNSESICDICGNKNMQNEPNLQNTQINLSSVEIENCENNLTFARSQKRTQNEPNLLEAHFSCIYAQGTCATLLIRCIVLSASPITPLLRKSPKTRPLL